MLFCSQQFLLFFLVVFTLYWSMPWDRARVWLLLAASFVFYAAWSEWLAVIICISTVMDYLIGRGLESSESPRRRKLLLGISLVGNLGLLAYFKYANFFLHSVQEALKAAGAESSLPVLNILLPLGISFYTFEAISYTMDVYRRRIPAERDLGHFMLFILFFPHLIAGPIVRARDFLPQISRPKRWDWMRLNLGMRFFILGVIKKLGIADRMAGVADPVFDNPSQYGTGALWLAAFAYALQIYCDFSGYSDMAIGTAHLLGYKLKKNFDLPYLAANIADFWRRWHISLSSWIRDYLFFPLGGSRGGNWQTNRNLLISMTLCGLWHGANWSFIVFGALHGGLLILHRYFREFCKPRPGLSRVLDSLPGTILRVAATITTVSLGWVIFRCATLHDGLTMLQRMLLPHTGLEARRFGMWLIWLLMGVVVVGHALGHRERWKRLVERLPSPVRGLGFAAALTLALLLAPEVQKVFIYFQF